MVYGETTTKLSASLQMNRWLHARASVAEWNPRDGGAGASQRRADRKPKPRLKISFSVM